MNSIKIAFPDRLGKKGALAYTRERLGDVPNLDSRNMLQVVGPYEFVITRGRYVPRAVEDGCLTGITGYDCLREYELAGNDGLEIVEDLDFGRASVVVFKDKGRELTGSLRVATLFPNIAREYMKDWGTEYKIEPMYGMIEGLVKSGSFDIGIDVLETGGTLRATDLEIMDEILDTNAIIISKTNDICRARRLWGL